MLKLEIDKHARLRNQPNTPSYLRKQGFSYWVSYQLVNAKKESISFSDMERLCVLFKCTPNDLLEWTPADAADAANEQHPLAPLKRENNDASSNLQNLSFEQLKQIAKALKEKK